MRRQLALLFSACFVSVSLAQSIEPVRMVDPGPAVVGPVDVKSGDVAFKIKGQFLISCQFWNKLGEGNGPLGDAMAKDVNKIGLGGMGNITAGVAFDDMYLGVGPHFGYNLWMGEYIGVEFEARVQDVGGDVVIGFGDFYITLGKGSSAVTVTAKAGGQSVEASADVSYSRIGLALDAGSGLMFGISSVIHESAGKNLDRLEVNFGFMF